MLKKPLAAAALAALAALCGSSRRGARLAAAGGALDVLEGLRGRVTRGSALGRAAERVYGKIARQSKVRRCCQVGWLWGAVGLRSAHSTGFGRPALAREARPHVADFRVVGVARAGGCRSVMHTTQE